MKLAVIADIHGNIHALEAVLQDIEQMKVDKVIVNGDLVNRGPNNNEVMERVTDLDYGLTLGNHDALIRMWIDRDDEIPKSWFDDPFWKGTDLVAQQLFEAGWIDTLRDLPMTRKIEVPGAPKLLISHGSPRHYREGYGTYVPDEQIAEIARLYPADIFIGSHTHKPMDRMWECYRFLNTGAVGAPFNGDRRAQYLIMTLENNKWNVEFRAIDYDYDAAFSAFEKSRYVPDGDLSAFIFREELRYARAIYNPFWMWTEKHEKPKNWNSWNVYWGKSQYTTKNLLARKSHE